VGIPFFPHIFCYLKSLLSKLAENNAFSS